MTLSPTERRQVLELVAERIVEELKAEAHGSLSSLVLIPVPTVARLMGLTAKGVERRFRVTTLGHRTRGVTLDQLQAVTKSS